MTTVRTADGGNYPIPTGPPGSYPWVREASLISVSYQQAGDAVNALKWNREYDKRRLAWEQVQAGADLDAIIRAGSWLDGPALIVAWLARKIDDIVSLAVDAGEAVVDWAKWLPLILVGAVVVVGVGLSKGTLRARV